MKSSSKEKEIFLNILRICILVFTIMDAAVLHGETLD